MIRQLYRVLGPEDSRPLNRLLALQSGSAALQGVAFVLLVPVLRACSEQTRTTCDPG